MVTVKSLLLIYVIISYGLVAYANNWPHADFLSIEPWETNSNDILIHSIWFGKCCMQSGDHVFFGLLSVLTHEQLGMHGCVFITISINAVVISVNSAD